MLSVNGLEVVYHRVVRVLNGISLELVDGGITALLGPNGAGKTTVLRAITGLLGIHEGRVTKGEIRFAGQSLTGFGPEDRVGRGLIQVMEGRRLFADLTVEENLLAGSYSQPRTALAESLAEAYERFPRLAERRGQLAGLLSGGEQQMLAISRALMAKPRCLLLDEPSLGLSPKAVADVAKLIAAIRDRGIAVLLVEQNAAMALDLADHAYVMESGRVVIDGTSEQLRSDVDIQEFYLGLGSHGRQDFRQVKHYQRRKRWLS